jgi:hypothetical protein
VHQWHLKPNDKHDLTDCGRVVMFYASVTIVCPYIRSWSYGSWIYYYLCNQCLSPLTLRVRILLWWGVHIYNIMWKSLSVTCGRSVVSPGTPVSSTNKNDHHDKNEILLKVTLNTITLHPEPCQTWRFPYNNITRRVFGYLEPGRTLRTGSGKWQQRFRVSMLFLSSATVSDINNINKLTHRLCY